MIRQHVRALVIAIRAETPRLPHPPSSAPTTPKTQREREGLTVVTAHGHPSEIVNIAGAAATVQVRPLWTTTVGEGMKVRKLGTRVTRVTRPSVGRSVALRPGRGAPTWAAERAAGRRREARVRRGEGIFFLAWWGGGLVW